MLATLCILTLVSLLMGKDPRKSLEKLRGVNWGPVFDKLLANIKTYAIKAGRIAARPLLTLYFVVTDKQTTTTEKAIIYGCLIYIVLPMDLLPRSVYKLLGLADDAAALAYVIKKVGAKITPDILLKVDQTLDRWFGTEVIVEQ